MEYVYEAITYDSNLPGKIALVDSNHRELSKNPHWHTEIEIVYVIRGTFHGNVNGKRYTITEGNFFLCNSEEVHNGYIYATDTNYCYLGIWLSYNLVCQYCTEFENYLFKVDTNEKAYSAMIKVIHSILERIDSSDPFNFITQAKYLLDIYHILLSDCKVEKMGRVIPNLSPRIKYTKQTLDFINKNFKEKITIEEIANQIGLSPQYMAKNFKKQTGYSFLQYLLIVRLEHALKDIVVNDLSVTEASFENGFKSVKSLINTCKKFYGVTPIKYKALYREKS